MLEMVLADGSIQKEGCDISYWQGHINPDVMYDAGIRFAIIRAGFGQTQDKNFVTYINQCVKKGIKVGIYWFLYAKNIGEAEKNAYKCIEVLKNYKDKISCGVWADWEYDSDKYAGNITVSKRCDMVRYFLNILQTEGYQTGIYSNQDYIRSGKFTEKLIAEYPLWFAKYAAGAGSYAGKGLGGLPYMWQYTSSGDGTRYGVGSKCIDLNHGYFETRYVSKDTILDQVQTDNTTIKAYENPYIQPGRTISYIPGKYIMRGDDVKWLQWHLWRFGLFLDKQGVPDASQIDGKWGENSNRALLEAKQRLQLPLNNLADENIVNIFKSI